MRNCQKPLTWLRGFLISFCAAALYFAPPVAAAADKPNILWITCEDMSADLGCYGDAYARSPNIDRFAADAVRFTNCFTHVGVCAPSRSGIITGMYPCSIGSHNMRSKIPLPPEVKCFPEYLRQAGYYCTNNSKTDYNFDTPAGAWDENGKNAHWRNRAEDQPFFAVFNILVTHESQIRAPEVAYQKNTARLTPEQRHDPAKATLPPYYPDTPLVRKDWARYHDNITAMDYQFADRLKELEEAGLLDNTIVFYYSDHGRGLPRAKRWLYDSSTHVPLIVRWPEKLRGSATKSDGLNPGTVRDELIAFVDLAPTVLSIAGVEIPEHMQGQAFLGAAQAEKPREYVYGARDRMDERVDLLRSVRDKRYKYIRNYEWWKPYAQNINYMNEMPTMREWRRVAAEGKLTEPQKLFMAAEKPREELYDCEADPHELRNLALDREHVSLLLRMRKAHEDWVSEVHDLGYLPEALLVDYQRKGPQWRDDRELQSAADACFKLWKFQFVGPTLKQQDTETMARKLLIHDAADRELLPLQIRCAEFLGGPWRKQPAAAEILLQAITIDDLAIRIAAARSLAVVLRAEDGTIDAKTLQAIRPIFVEGLKSEKPVLRHRAALAVDDLGTQAKEFLPEIEAMLKIDKDYAARVGEYILATRK